jgi:predicted phage baseplate assembly protein
MSEVWWGPASHDAPDIAADGTPILLASSRSAVTANILAKIPAFTPEWTNRSSADAGIALTRLFGELMEPALQRLNQLPEKSMIEFFDVAGVSPNPATPAEVLLEFQASSAAPQSVLVASGFQTGASAADGSGDLVIFETTGDVYVAPAKIAAMYTEQGGEFIEIDLKGQASDPPVPFWPFGSNPKKDCALVIGLDSRVAPNPRLSLGAQLAPIAGSPAPASRGALLPLPDDSSPTLVWEVLDGASFVAAELLSDETTGFSDSGIIELGLPRQWRSGTPAGVNAGELFWFRVRILFGEFTSAPQLSFFKINMVRALGARTIRDEVPDPVANSGGNQFQLSQTPVLTRSLQLRVDQGGFDPATGAELSGDEGQIWTEVDSLLDSDGDALVYELDDLTGIITFGDGNHGALVPPGFRNVVAVSYQAGGGSAGAVDAQAVTTLLDSAPFLSSVSNPLKAAGGTPRESNDDAMRRAPQEIRARDRAVTVADYALLATRGAGVNIRRAQAISGFHPLYRGAFIPGVVGVIVVPPDPGDGNAPMPSEETLDAVARSLSGTYAPAGVDVVVGAPRYHSLRAEVGLLLDTGANEAAVIQTVLQSLDNYIDPLQGGDDGLGWPFGGTLRYFTLLRTLTSIAGVKAIPRLNLLVDGIRQPGCADIAIEADALFWPDTHEVTVLSEAEA